jgi:hypothetical protein
MRATCPRASPRRRSCGWFPRGCGPRRGPYRRRRSGSPRRRRPSPATSPNWKRGSSRLPIPRRSRPRRRPSAIRTPRRRRGRPRGRSGATRIPAGAGGRWRRARPAVRRGRGRARPGRRPGLAPERGAEGEGDSGGQAGRQQLSAPVVHPSSLPRSPQDRAPRGGRIAGDQFWVGPSTQSRSAISDGRSWMAEKRTTVTSSSSSTERP